MTMADVMDVMHEAMLVALKLCAPILIISMGVGLVISIFQAATQIHEQTLSFVPKLVAIAVVLILTGPWMSEVMIDFTHYIFNVISTFN